MRSPTQIREHLRQVERELLLAIREGRLTEAGVRAYVNACQDVDALNATERALRAANG